MPGKKREFITHADVNQYYAKERRLRPWLCHSIALVVLSPRRDQLLLVAPTVAQDRGQFSLTLPQVRCTGESYPTQLAAKLLRQVYKKAHKLLYIGSGRNDVRGGERMAHKIIHVFGLQADQYEDCFRRPNKPPNEQYQQIRWCNTRELRSLPAANGISDRKYEILLQAILRFHQQLENQRFHELLNKQVEEKLHKQFDDCIRDGYTRSQIENEVKAAMKAQNLNLVDGGKLFAVAHEELKKKELLMMAAE